MTNECGDRAVYVCIQGKSFLGDTRHISRDLAGVNHQGAVLHIRVIGIISMSWYMHRRTHPVTFFSFVLTVITFPSPI